MTGEDMFMSLLFVITQSLIYEYLDLKLVISPFITLMVY